MAENDNNPVFRDLDEPSSVLRSARPGELLKRCNITVLPVEIFDMIVDYLGVQDIKNVRMCCSTLAHLAFHAVFSRSKLVIPLCDQGSRDLLMMTRRGVGRHVRGLVFIECNHAQPHQRLAFEKPESSRTCLALRKLTKVTHLEWSSGGYFNPDHHQFSRTIRGENILSIYFNFTGCIRHLDIDAWNLDCRGFSRTICACDNLIHLTIRQWAGGGTQDVANEDLSDYIWNQSMTQMRFVSGHFEHMRSLKIERNELCLKQLLPLLQGLQQTLVRIQLICSSLKVDEEDLRKLFDMSGNNEQLEDIFLWRRPPIQGAGAIVLSREQFLMRYFNRLTTLVQGFGMGEDAQYNFLDIRKDKEITWALWTG
ncbi:uncharacterized protein PV09_08980 [Verruconis gallopava]|uniref:F-box domain-containing protein n=1 Tax=Verruconis gallopava TaxID=253628 RepID=A0A0D1XAS5_9PEZI|nr:uncharacterized protein PV09_08980 [Verruconis gallopava]KIV99320.1 hypothetical protein PV09_08980 [Verruconis gallopava]